MIKKSMRLPWISATAVAVFALFPVAAFAAINVYSNFESGSNGQALTAAILTAGTPCNTAPGGSWSFDGNGAQQMSVSTAAEEPLPSSLTCNGTTYPANDGTRGISYNLDTSDSGFAQFVWNATSNNASDGAWINVGVPTSDTDYHSMFGISDGTGDFVSMMIHSGQIYIEVGANPNGADVVGTPFNYTANTWYWVTEQFQTYTGSSSMDSLNIYSTSGTLLSSQKKYSATYGNVQPYYIFLGKGGDTGTPNDDIYYDNFVADTSAGTFPLLPGTFAGGSGTGSTGGSGTTTPTPDTTPPSVPTSLTATTVSMSQVNISWQASTDNVGVAGYYVYRNGAKIATVTGTSYSDTGLSAGTTYSYTVAAYDAAGNVSSPSAAVSGTTSAATTSGSGSGSGSSGSTAPTSGGSEAWSGILPAGEGINWSQTGIPGGIPTTRTQCGSTISPPSGDATQAIQSALNSCGANHYVLLGPGMFTIDSSISIPSNVTLRGSGANETILSTHGNEQAPIVMGNSGVDYSGAVNITSGDTAGSASIGVSSASGISVGSYLVISEVNTGDITDSGGEGDCTWCDGWSTNGARSNGQIVEVTSVSGNTLGISPGLYTAYTDAPTAVPFQMSTSYAGVEDLQVYMNNTGYTDAFYMTTCADCWVYGNEVNYTDGDYVEMDWGYQDVIQGNYFSNAYIRGPGTTDDDIFPVYKTSASQIVNNIMDRPQAGIFPSRGAAGNVIAYNYITGSFSSPNDFAIGGIGMHGANPQFNLIEGNVIPLYYPDQVWGSSDNNTTFRNWVIGTSQACAPISGARGTVTCSPSSDYEGSAARAMQIGNLSTYDNFVGDVVGSTQLTDLGIPAVASVAYPATRQYDSDAYGYSWGYGESSDDGTGTGCDGGTDLTGQCHSTLAQSTAFLDGEYNYISNATTWASGLSQSLPASFYLASKPSWWPSSLAFPAIGPDITGGNSAAGGHADDIPAQYCYLNIMGGTDGGGGSPLTFNATTCYGALTASGSGTGSTGTGSGSGTTSPAPVITSGLSVSTTVGKSFSYTIVASNNPTAYSASSLPSGFVINNGTGVITGTPSTAGTYNATISASNGSGTGSATLTIVVAAVANTTPPVTSITAPPANSTVSGGITVQASASDNVGVTEVVLCVDGVAEITDTVAPYTFSLNTQTLSNGAHTLQTKAYDAAGNVGTSAIVTVNVSNTSSGSGTPSSTTSSALPNGYYSTTFPLTENPISEGGVWLNGGTNGTDWGNVQTTPGLAFGVSLPSSYGDPTAVLKGTWAANQMAQATVRYTGATTSSGYREVELRLRAGVTSGDITGYEIDCSVVPGDPYLQIVRWNGLLNNFTYLVIDQGVYCANGDLLKATAIGNNITVYKNGTQVLQTTDTTFPTGAPGMGFYDTTNNWNQLGFTNFTASNVTSTTTSTPTSTPAVNPPVITGLSSGSSVVYAGSYFSTQIEATNNPTSYGATSLPTGLTVNPSTGLISGTLPSAGTYAISLSATNAGGTGTATLNFTVNAASTGSTPTSTTSAAPVLTGILPSSGATGSSVVLLGSGFGPSDTVLMNGMTAASDVASDGTSLTFTVPSSLAPNCTSGEACPDYMLLITPNTYSVTVTGPNGTSNAVSFTVTSVSGGGTATSTGSGSGSGSGGGMPTSTTTGSGGSGSGSGGSGGNGNTTGSGTTGKVGGTPTSTYNYHFSRRLFFGMSGSDVQALQQFLKSLGYFPSSVTPTMYFGPITENAVQKYQAANGIVSSGTPATTGYGQVGPRTLASLNGGQ